VGGAKPPDSAKMDQGWSGTVVAPVYGENEEGDPWKQPYHTELGFKPTDNVVTVASGTPPGNNSDHASNNAKDLAENMTLMMNNAGGGIGCLKSTNALLFLAPEHAATIASDGWTKEDLRKFLWDKTRAPYWAFPAIPKGASPSTFNCVPPPEFGPYTDDTLIPIFDSPKRIQIAVVGGPGKHSMVWSLERASVSVLIDKWR
jgi:hypothetical protein